LAQDFLARQVEAWVFDQDRFELLEGATDGGFADTIGHGDVSEGAIFSPVHQDHQEPIFQTELGVTSSGGQSFLEHLDHEGEGFLGDASQAFEDVRFAVLEVKIVHASTMAQTRTELCKRSNVIIPAASTLSYSALQDLPGWEIRNEL